MSERRRVVITGIGPVTPVGTGIDAFWRGLTSGANGVRPIEAFDTSDLPVSVAGFPVDFVVADHLDLKEARRTDPFAQYAIASAKLAWADAGEPEVRSERGAVIYATGIGGVQTLLHQHDVLREKGAGRVSPVHGADADGQRRRRPHRDALRAHRAELLHRLRVFLVEPRDRRGDAADPRRVQRPRDRGWFRGGDDPAHGGGVRADDGADEEPRPRDRLAPVRRRAQRVRAVRGGLRADHGERGAREGARRSHLLRGRGLRRERRRAPHHRARPQGLGRGARDDVGLADAGEAADRRRLRERPRHLDAAERRGRDRGDQDACSASTRTRWPSHRRSR